MVISNILLFQNDLPEGWIVDGDLAIDTEAMGLHFARDRLCTVQFCGDNHEPIIVQFTNDKYHAPNLCALLNDPNRVKIFHFARFDLAIIKRYLGVELRNIFCTKIASKLARTYTDMHSLKELCRELLGVTLSKQQQSSDWGQANLSKDQLEYASRDVIHLHQLRDILKQMLLREGRLELAQEVFTFLPTRAKLDLLGWQDHDILAHH